MNIIGRLGGGMDVVFGKEHLENGANLGTTYRVVYYTNWNWRKKSDLLTWIFRVTSFIFLKAIWRRKFQTHYHGKKGVEHPVSPPTSWDALGHGQARIIDMDGLCSQRKPFSPAADNANKYGSWSQNHKVPASNAVRVGQQQQQVGADICNFYIARVHFIAGIWTAPKKQPATTECSRS